MLGRLILVAKKIKRGLLRPAYWREQDALSKIVLPLSPVAAEASVSKLSRRFTAFPASEMRDRQTAQLLGDVTLGFWTIDGSSLEWLCGEVRRKKPSAILEFGSGVSTVCFASIMKEIHGSASPCVFSVEQDAEQAVATAERLTAAGVASVVKILVAPVVEQTVEGQETWCYDLGDASLDLFLAGATPEIILVDGPAGRKDRSGVRFGTLPLCKRFVNPGAMFYLHDGFRADEIDVGKRWSNLPYIHVAGIRPIGHGLITGHFI